MRHQRGHASRDVVWTGALPVPQLRVRRGLRARSPVVVQFAGIGFGGALREPRAVPHECREFVVHHFIPLFEPPGPLTKEGNPFNAETQRAQRKRRENQCVLRVPSSTPPRQIHYSSPNCVLCAYLCDLCVSALNLIFFPHHFMPNLSKYQSSLRTRRASISRRRSEI